MNIRKTLLSGILASSMAFGGAAAFAQDATPDDGMDDVEATPMAEITTMEGVPLVDTEGNVVATADIWEDEEDGGVWFSIHSEDTATSGLAEGMMGVHVHETGVCDADTGFESAGDHFNPTNEEHGDINADPSHAGDLGNLEVDDEGAFEHEVLAEKLTMTTGVPNSLADEDGTALLIHTGEDDLETDPDGNAGDPWACGVIFAAPEEQGTPEATPQADEAAPGQDQDEDTSNDDDGAMDEEDVVVTDDEDAPEDLEEESDN